MQVSVVVNGMSKVNVVRTVVWEIDVCFKSHFIACVWKIPVTAADATDVFVAQRRFTKTTQERSCH